MSVTFQDIATELGNSFTKGTQTQEGILQNIVNFFCNHICRGYNKTYGYYNTYNSFI